MTELELAVRRQLAWRVLSQGLVSALATNWLLLAGVLIGAAALRLWRIDDLGFNSDEAVYMGQAAAIANHVDLSEFFPVFRAHPLLYQSILSLGFASGLEESFGRVLSAAVGVATVYMVYKLGELMYGRTAGLVAALLMAVMPYHVVVTRQVLLDGPETLFATVTLYLTARFVLTSSPPWLYAAGAAMGLTFLSKETAILFLGAFYAFFALSPTIPFRLKQIAIALGVMALVILPFPVSMLLADRADTGESYLAWQLFRRPNHEWSFYPSVVPPAMGWLVVAAAASGLWLLRRKGSWREILLLSWIIVPGLFFQLWPVKGFQYLLPLAPAVAVLAGRTISSLPEILRQERGWLTPAVAGLVALTLLIPSVRAIEGSKNGEFLAGSGGVPGGREAGRWVGENAPEGSRIMTIGPSMANIIQFYGHRKAYGLSVSPNPLHRNPSYEPITNPDLQLRSNQIHYIIWDSFSAARSSFFSDGILRYVDRYNGRVVHVESVPVQDEASGQTIRKPVIIIYEVHR
ncbi:MAG: phospholipid carrier-dependent glycosyltransferase [Dehalococcoidia bacterium]|nr:phospholipid carrier-dependent glycosyltransferase [Dehalococcoidia bacterium]